VLRVLEYGPDREATFRPFAVSGLEQLVAAAASTPLLWVDASSPEPEETTALADQFGWHPLVREDITHGGQRQKAEQFPGQVLAVLRLPRAGAARSEDLYVVQAEHVLVTVHTMPDEWLDRRAAEVAARTDIATHCAAGAMATLLGAIADTYETSIDRLEELVERQEADALSGEGDPGPALRRNAGARTIIADVRRSCGQLREVVGVFVRRELLDTVHTAELDLEMRDVLDHVIRSHEDLDTLHDRMSALADTRLAMVAYRQNEITKKLSAWAAVLLVPTIVTGWFGMNFHHMIGLANRWGELYALALILGVMGGIYAIMRRARWL
jgi:magnesium transporter